MNFVQKLRDYFFLRGRNTSFRPADYSGFENWKRMAILFESGNYDEQILDFAKKMKGEGKEVELMGFIPRKRKEVIDVPKFPHFTKTEVKGLGKPKSDDVSAFLKNHFEVFISLNEKRESPLQFIEAATQADFAIGLRKVKYARFDLILESNPNQNIGDIFKEIEYYLKFINSAPQPPKGGRSTQIA